MGGGELDGCLVGDGVVLRVTGCDRRDGDHLVLDSERARLLLRQVESDGDCVIDRELDRVAVGDNDGVGDREVLDDALDVVDFDADAVDEAERDGDSLGDGVVLRVTEGERLAVADLVSGLESETVLLRAVEGDGPGSRGGAGWWDVTTGCPKD